MKLFILVFSEESKNILIENGFHYLNENQSPHYYVFVNNPDKDVNELLEEYVTTCTLSFTN